MDLKPYNEQEFNRLCAEFMGLTPLTRPYLGAYALNTPSLIPETFLRLCHEEMAGESWYLYPKFHSDWNWIMEVVEKISNIPDGVGYVFIRDLDGVMHKKQVVVQAIWQFINWYNEQKQ